MDKKLYIVVRVEDGEVSVEHFDNFGEAEYYIQCEYWAIYNSDFHSNYSVSDIAEDKMSAYYNMYYFDGRKTDVNAIQWHIFDLCDVFE